MGPDPTNRKRTARRLRDLERRGLVSVETPGRWRVPADLLERLRRSDGVESSRYRLLLRQEPRSLEGQVQYRGPVWLDRVDPKPVSPHGFGGDVQRALQSRREVLRGLGVSLERDKRVPGLLRLEREAIGQRFAAQTRQVFVKDVPGGFRGRAQAYPTPTGASYTIVSDGSRFIVVRTHDSRTLHGKAVTITRDANGRPIVRAAGDREIS